MKSFVVATFIAFSVLGACVQSSAPETGYFQGKPVQLKADVTPGMFDGVLELYINNELAISQRSQAFGGSSQTFDGKWKGHLVRARATRVENMFSSYVMIDVFIDGTLVDTLNV